MAHKVRIGHTLKVAGTKRTGKSATLTLRIMRNKDGLVYDWNDGTFKALASATTPAQAATEHNSTNDPGWYYWEIGAASTPDDVFPAAFTDGEYRFVVEESSLGYEWDWSITLRNQRDRTLLVAQIHQNKKALDESATGNLIIYEDDEVTVMMTRTVKDKAGGPISLASGVPAQESPG